MTDQVDLDLYRRMHEICLEGDSVKLAEILPKEADDAKALINYEEDGQYILHQCIENGFVACVSVLLENGASMTLADKDGFLAIHHAVKRDFDETLMLLIRHGVDINAPTTGDEPKTPLQLARHLGATASEDFLLFSCIKDCSDVLDEADQKRHSHILKGLDCKKIAIGLNSLKHKRQQADKDIYQDMDKLGIEIDCKEEALIQIRRVEVDFESSSIRVASINPTDDEEVISDIYQYKVSVPVDCDVTVPVMAGYDKRKGDEGKYYKVVVRHTAELNAEWDDVTLKEGKAVIRKLPMKAQGVTPIVSFCVVSQTKATKKSIILGSDEVKEIPSGIVPEFSLQVQGRKNTTTEVEVELKVVPAVNPIESSSDSASNESIGGHSHFCLIQEVAKSSDSCNTPRPEPESSGSDAIKDDKDAIEPKNERNKSPTPSQELGSEFEDMVVYLPCPEEEEEKETQVAICPQSNDHFDPSSWDFVDRKKKDIEKMGANKRRVSVKTTVLGCFLPFNFTKHRSLGYLVKEWICELFMAAKGEKRRCILYATIESTPVANRYLTEIHLCIDKEFKKIQKEQKSKLSELGPCEPLDIRTKDVYILKWSRDDPNLNVDEPDSLPIMLQGSKPKSQTFEVEVTEGNPLGFVYLFKKDLPKKVADYPKKAKRCLPIMLMSLKTETIEQGFCNDKFIEEAGEEMGDNWYELGIFLGFNCKEMDGLEDTEPRKRNASILYKWRDDKRNKTPDDPHGLDKLFRALRLAEGTKLRNKFSKEVEKFTDTKKWLERNRSLPTPQHVFSPYEDEFLLGVVVKNIPQDDKFFESLKLTPQEIEQSKRKSNVRRKCDLMRMSREKCGKDVLKFYDKLLSSLRKWGCLLAVSQISECARIWMDGNQAGNVNTQDLKRSFGLK